MMQSTILSAIQLLGIFLMVLALGGGLKLILAKDNEERAKSAKHWILLGVIGLAVILLGYVVFQVISNKPVIYWGKTNIVNDDGKNAINKQQCNNICESEDSRQCPTDCACDSNGSCDSARGETKDNCPADCSNAVSSSPAYKIEGLVR